MNEMKNVILTMVVLAVSVSASAQSIYADSWDPDADADGNVGVTDLLALLSVFGDYDLDNDGIWDSVDDCVGEYDECGVCNGEGIAQGLCSCDSLVYDAIGVCGGDCIADLDNDGVCDSYACIEYEQRPDVNLSSHDNLTFAADNSSFAVFSSVLELSSFSWNGTEWELQGTPIPPPSGIAYGYWESPSKIIAKTDSTIDVLIAGFAGDGLGTVLRRYVLEGNDWVNLPEDLVLFPESALFNPVQSDLSIKVSKDNSTLITRYYNEDEPYEHHVFHRTADGWEYHSCLCTTDEYLDGEDVIAISDNGHYIVTNNLAEGIFVDEQWTKVFNIQDGSGPLLIGNTITTPDGYMFDEYGWSPGVSGAFIQNDLEKLCITQPYWSDEDSSGFWHGKMSEFYLDNGVWIENSNLQGENCDAFGFSIDGNLTGEIFAIYAAGACLGAGPAYIEMYMHSELGLDLFQSPIHPNHSIAKLNMGLNGQSLCAGGNYDGFSCYDFNCVTFD